MIRIAVCVDDTDDLTKTTSTGRVADDLADLARELGGEVELGVTRHQLPLIETIGYTSHNSSMCFTALMPDDFSMSGFHSRAAQTVVSGSVDAADPGLCIYRLPDPIDEDGMKRLVSYGIFAKTDFVTKDEAYATAAAIDGLSLTEHGGGGEGVIGALAGVALRLSGSDGRFRGKVKLFAEPKTLRLSDLITLLGGPETTQVCDSVNQTRLAGDPLVTVPVELKPILLDGKRTLIAEPLELLEPLDGAAIAISYEVIDWQCVKDRYDARPRWEATCDAYVDDNDIEEFADTTHARICSNCLYRRWIPGGFRCVAGYIPMPITGE
ncbi:MAG: hypothetical protein HGA54_02955 [Actinobacteria bacterium]|nr:hypothetical protein [Actinomycetota bacterium]